MLYIQANTTSNGNPYTVILALKPLFPDSYYRLIKGEALKLYTVDVESIYSIHGDELRLGSMMQFDTFGTPSHTIVSFTKPLP